MKVKIDEGAYIAEWVFHHLYFGFDAIDVYVNRTTFINYKDYLWIK